VFLAWGDESGSVPSLDPGAFLLAAAVCAVGDLDGLRERMTRMRRPSEKKIHWRDDSRVRHDEVTREIAAAGVEAIVVVRVGSLDERPERRRRKCFERFAAEVERSGCGILTMESRGAGLDRKDRDMVDAMRAARTLDGTLRLEHAPGPAEPMLWIADAVCGAVVASRTGDPAFLRRIERAVHLVEVRT
jgi:hypothetical protein